MIVGKYWNICPHFAGNEDNLVLVEDLPLFYGKKVGTIQLYSNFSLVVKITLLYKKL